MSDSGLTSPFEVSRPRHQPPREAAVMSDTGSLKGRETVLVVEDERPVLELIRDVMRLQGYTVLVAPDSDEALRAVGQHQGPIHLLILDAVMPGIPTGELLARVQAAHPGLKTLYISGYTDDLISQHGLLDVGRNFLQKPFAVDALVRKVRELLDTA